jgi:phage gpG-like protein
MEVRGLKETFQIFDKLTTATKTLPSQAAILAVNFSKERFVEQSWKDSSKERWKPRKSNNKRSKRRRNGAILVDTVRLKRSIRKIQVGNDYAIIGTDVPYAQIHNEGGEVNTTASVKSYTKKEHTRRRNGRKEKVRSHTVNSHKRNVRFKMPKRQFIGESATLAKRIENMITVEFSKALKNKE